MERRIVLLLKDFGSYFPLVGSTSFAAKPKGMDAAEACQLWDRCFHIWLASCWCSRARINVNLWVLCRSPIHPDTAHMLAGLIYARMLEVWCQGVIWCFFLILECLNLKFIRFCHCFWTICPKLSRRRRCCWTQGSCFVNQILLLSSALVEDDIGLKVVGSSSWNPKMTQVLWLPGSMRRNISKSWWHLGWIDI